MLIYKEIYSKICTIKILIEIETIVKFLTTIDVRHSGLFL